MLGLTATDWPKFLDRKATLESKLLIDPAGFAVIDQAELNILNEASDRYHRIPASHPPAAMQTMREVIAGEVAMRIKLQLGADRGFVAGPQPKGESLTVTDYAADPKVMAEIWETVMAKHSSSEPSDLIPMPIATSIDQYSMQSVDDFVVERMILDPTSTLKVADAFAAYNQWASKNKVILIKDISRFSSCLERRLSFVNEPPRRCKVPSGVGKNRVKAFRGVRLAD